MSGDNFSFAPVTQKAHVSISRTDHSQSMMKSVDDIFQKQLFTDVVLSCENQIINAHKLILAASSSFFYSLFNSQPTCLTVNPVIIIRDVKINELKAILEFIYYGTTTFAETDINNLIKSADALGVLGLSKINPDQIKDKLKDDEEEDDEDEEQEKEINNNTLNNSEYQLRQKDSLSNSKEPQTKSINDQDKLKSKNNQISSNLINNKNNSEKNKRRLLNRQTASDTEDQTRKNDELEMIDLEKGRKKEVSNQNLINSQTQNLSQPVAIASSSTTNDQKSSSKRQSLRIRCRKDNLEPQSNQESAKKTFDDLLNTSNNSSVSLGDLISTNGNKRLKVRSEDEEELMSIDGSQYDNSNNLLQKDTQLDKQSDSTNDTNNKISINFKEKTLKLKRNKNSILKKQESLINLDSKRQKSELIDLQSNSNQPDDNLDEEIILKKIDSSSTSLNTSRKNSVDSNNHDELVIKLRNDKNNDINNQSNSLLATTSFTKQQSSQQKKKKRKISIDANS